MAKKSKKDSINDAKVENAVAELVDGDVTFDLSADVQIGPDHIVKVCVAEFEQKVRAELNAGKTKISILSKRLKDLEGEWKEAKEKAAAALKPPVLKAAKFFYAVQGLDCEWDTGTSEKEDDAEGFTVHVKFYSAKTQRNNYRGDPECHYTNPWSYSTNLTFKQAKLTTQHNELMTAREELQAVKELQLRWQGELSRVGEIQRHAEAQMARAVMSASGKGQALLKQIEATSGVALLSNIPSMLGLPSGETK